MTGGASGIGLALAEAFAAEGMRIVLADVETAALDRACGALRETGAEVLGVVTDVADAAAVDALAARTFAEFGTAHVVCNNAGVGGLGDELWDGPLAAWEWVVGVNLMGVVHGVRSFGGRLVEQDEGAIVEHRVARRARRHPPAAAYTATKHAVLGLTETLAQELAMQGSAVTAHVCAPGSSGRGSRLGPQLAGTAGPEAAGHRRRPDPPAHRRTGGLRAAALRPRHARVDAVARVGSTSRPTRRVGRGRRRARRLVDGARARSDPPSALTVRRAFGRQGSGRITQWPPRHTPPRAPLPGGNTSSRCSTERSPGV